MSSKFAQPENVFDVAISGYGPTGLAAASLLAQRGHSVCVFERWPTLYGQPRIATIDGESARIIQAAGDAEHAFRNSVSRPRYLLANGEGKVLVDFDWSGEHVCGHPFRISLHQPDIEDAMDARARMAGAQINTGWEVCGIEQAEDFVAVTAQQRDSDAKRVIRARYVIGADGARSVTRELLGIERESWPFRGAWFTVDATRKRELPDFLGQSPDGRIAAIFCAPEGRAHSIIPLGKDVIRINFQIDPDVDRKSVADPAIAYRYLKETYGLTSDDLEVFRQAVHVFEGRLASQWRKGRVFIAGDAAHAMTPFMGQGGCSALRDSANLSWKLDLVLRGMAADKLLDSYEAERKPHARYYVHGSDRLGALAFIGDKAAARQRDEVYVNQPAAPAQAEPIIKHGILHLDAAQQPIAPAGEVGPQALVIWQGRKALFDDIFGWGFQILYRGISPEQILRADQLVKLSEIKCALAGIGSGTSRELVQDITGRFEKFFGEHGINGLILRPDFVIYAGLHAPEDMVQRVDELIAQVTASTSSP